MKLPKEYYLEDIANYNVNDVRNSIEASLSVANNRIIHPLRVLRFSVIEHQQVFEDIYNYVLDLKSEDVVTDVMSLMDESGFFD